MKKSAIGLCFALAIGFAAALGAQSTPTSSQTTTGKGEHDVTVTGCLSKGAAGTYTLTNARVDDGKSSTTTAAGATTTAGTTGSTAANAASSMSPAMTWMLSGDSDLEKHVGHKIQVTGKSSWDPMEHGRTSTTTAAGSGTTAAPPSSSTSGASSSEPHLDVKSIKMVSTSCP